VVRRPVAILLLVARLQCLRVEQRTRVEPPRQVAPQLQAAAQRQELRQREALDRPEEAPVLLRADAPQPGALRAAGLALAARMQSASVAQQVPLLTSPVPTIPAR
jgi:hypothetical protein